MISRIPQPQYSAEHKEQAKQDGRPLFTFDIYHYSSKRRTTITGVLSDEQICGIVTIVRRIMNAPATGAEKE